MVKERTSRLNSLLKEVIDEVIRKDVGNRDVHELMTVTRVDISRDLHHAKVYISVIGTAVDKAKTMEALKSAADFIAVKASKKMVIRYFPALTFYLDDSVDKHMKIDTLLHQLADERDKRQHLENGDEESHGDEGAR